MSEFLEFAKDTLDKYLVNDNEKILEAFYPLMFYSMSQYIEQNPVKAGFVKTPGDYRWSSARHYLGEHEDPLLASSLLGPLIDDWADFLSSTGNVKHNENICFQTHFHDFVCPTSCKLLLALQGPKFN